MVAPEEGVMLEDFIAAVHGKITEILKRDIDFGKAVGLRSFLIDQFDNGVKVDEAARLAIDEFY